jgi:hypothetical protein
VAVSEAEIREARRRVEESEGISPCFSAAAAMAGLIQLARNDGFSRNSVVVVNLTGGDRSDSQQSCNITWIRRTPEGWTAPPPAAFNPRATGGEPRSIGFVQPS